MKTTIFVAALNLLMSQGAFAQDSTKTDSLSREEADSLRWEKILQGVTVSAQRQYIKTDIDRIGYDVQADPDSKTETLLDMLRKVPFVSVDADENIKVKGNSRFKIYKNGHYDPSLSKNAKDIFKALPASMIKRIEVITDPGAKEDAEGVDAILNIVINDNHSASGVTGTVNGTAGTMGQTQLGTNLTTQLGKLIVGIDYGYHHMTRKSTSNESVSTRSFKESGNTLHAKQESSNPGYVHWADINASYDIDSLNLLSASFGGYFYSVRPQGTNFYDMRDTGGASLYSYDGRYFFPHYKYHSWNGRADYEHRTRRKGETFTLSYMIDLSRQRQDQHSSYLNLINAPFAYTENKNITKENYTEHTFQADWTRPLWTGHTLSVGTKYIARLTNSHTTQTFNNPQATGYDNRFEHNTHIVAGYADYVYTKDKWSARAGLRYEYSYMSVHYPDASDTDFHHHMSDWVPQASLKYQMTDRQSLKLTYTTSISRPGISYLNPARVISTESIQEGNARLKSSHSQGITLNYLFTGSRITLQLAPTFKFLDSGIGMVKSALGDKTYQTYGNIERMRRWQFEGYVQWKPFNTTTLISNFNIWHTGLRNPSIALEHNGWGGFYYVSLNQQLPLKLRLSVSSYGSIGHNVDNVYAYSRSYSMIGASLQRSFLKEDRLTVRLQAVSPFKHDIHQKSCTIHGDFTGDSDSWMPVRRYNLTVSWRFGRLNTSVKKASRTIENTDVVGGIKKSN